MSKRKKLTEYPDLIRQWDYEKNELNPTQMTAGSGAIVWWVCDKGHSWRADIKSRAKGNGCPYCAGKKAIIGLTDLETCRPELMKEWDYEKNILIPSQVTCFSKKRAWWLCEKGHSWEAEIGSRSNGSGCPVCAGRQALAGYNDLQTLRPDLAGEWDYDKNAGFPSQFTLGSNEPVWWICANGHSWKTSICNRSNRKTGTGCPYCAGKAVISGTNDLQTLNPRLASEWDFNKNDLYPSQVMAMSNKNVWWICDKGHSWQAQVCCRNTGGGCPYCAGKRALAGFNDLQTINPKLAEEWDYEKNVLLPSQVTSASGKIVWWKCDNGHSWQDMVAHRKYGCGCPYCSKLLSRKISINQGQVKLLKPLKPELIDEWDYEKNESLPTEFSSGSDKKVWWKCSNGHSWQTRISRRSNGSGCPYCDRRLVLPGFNDLQTINPGLAQEWDWDKNSISPSQIVIGSNRFVWWKCKKGHSYESPVAKRNMDNYGCPYCSGQRVLEGFNDLQSCNPILASEWDYEKNKLLPTQVTSGSDKKAWWKCAKGHSWQAVIRSRKAGKGCPYCAGRYVLQGFNDLQTLRPELAEEWDFEQNSILPTQVTLFSGISVWWKCAKGHSWKTAVLNRSFAGCGCPYCSGYFPYTSRCVQ